MQFAYKVTDFKPNNMRETIRNIFYWILAGIVLANSPGMEPSIESGKELVKNAVESIESYISLIL